VCQVRSAFRLSVLSKESDLAKRRIRALSLSRINRAMARLRSFRRVSSIRIAKGSRRFFINSRTDVRGMRAEIVRGAAISRSHVGETEDLLALAVPTRVPCR